MGQTLENGVYLPSEGERNCYAGLKTNWEILDQKVADVTALQQAVAGALHRQIVASLPTTDIDPNTIYMVLSGTSATENVYNEFMYVNNAWELIGTSATDLTNYYTKAEVDGKLLLKANASDLTSHTGDTTIHVTTADKNRWNNQTYVFRYSSTALTASSTNSNTLLDNTNNLKVGDKVIDSSGVLFSITAIDTQNSTFTIGTALIDLAQDSAVVHKSGDETIDGQKTLVNLLPLKGKSLGTEASNNARSLLYFLANRDTQDQSGIFLTKFRQNKAQGDMSGNDVAYLSFDCLENSVRTNNGLRINFLNFVDDIPQRFILWSGISEKLLGAVGAPWSGVYATNYYYGNDNVEFSTKFVTTDTAQTISGNKTFSSINGVEPGSLSLPSGNASDFIDISSYFDNTSATNSYTASANGWIYLRLGDLSGCEATVLDANNNRMWGQTTTGRVEQLTIPILKGQTLLTQWATTSTVIVDIARFIPCQGNV